MVQCVYELNHNSSLTTDVLTTRSLGAFGMTVGPTKGGNLRNVITTIYKAGNKLSQYDDVMTLLFSAL